MEALPPRLMYSATPVDPELQAAVNTESQQNHFEMLEVMGPEPPAGDVPPVAPSLGLVAFADLAKVLVASDVDKFEAHHSEVRETQDHFSLEIDVDVDGGAEAELMIEVVSFEEASQYGQGGEGAGGEEAVDDEARSALESAADAFAALNDRLEEEQRALAEYLFNTFFGGESGNEGEENVRFEAAYAIAKSFDEGAKDAVVETAGKLWNAVAGIPEGVQSSKDLVTDLVGSIAHESGFIDNTPAQQRLGETILTAEAGIRAAPGQIYDDVASGDLEAIGGYFQDIGIFTGTLAAGMGSGGGRLLHGQKSTSSTFEQMIRENDPAEADRYRSYWQQRGDSYNPDNTRNWLQVPPGIAKITDIKVSADGSKTYVQESFYDQFRRLTVRTDRTDHGRSQDHPNPHHHILRIDYDSNPNTPQRIWSGPIPGEFPQPNQ